MERPELRTADRGGLPISLWNNPGYRPRIANGRRVGLRPINLRVTANADRRQTTVPFPKILVRVFRQAADRVLVE